MFRIHLLIAFNRETYTSLPINFVRFHRWFLDSNVNVCEQLITQGNYFFMCDF